ncbi:MAG: DpnD/PcfM family protein [Synergistaceae bacterium]|nr:DpnD/PcfM family protein [Synergistaceae bacterium]
MKIFKVEIKEIRLRAVSIKADNKEDAEQRAMDAWKNGEITLDDSNDFYGVETEALNEGIDDDGSITCEFEADTVAGGYK